MKRALALIFALLFVAGMLPSGGSPDSDYVRIYQLMQQADTLSAGGQAQPALDKYREAQTELKKLQTANPTWNEKLVKFRLNYLREKIAALSSQTPASSSKAPAETRVEPKAAGPDNGARQIADLKEQNRQLEADRRLLEAKLREALSAQPAAVDPRELAKAEAQLKSLQQENEALRISLQQAKTNAVDPAQLERANRALAAAEEKIQRQQETISTLTLEKEAVQNRLQGLNERVPVLTAENEVLKKELATLQSAQRKTGRQTDATLFEQTQSAMLAANEKLRQETEARAVLRREKDVLETRLKAMSDTLANLHQQNDKLARQLAVAKAKTEPRKPNEKLTRQLQAVNAELQRLKSANSRLSLEKAALENKFREFTARESRHGAQVLAEASPPPSPKSRTRDERAENKQIKRLERERDELQKKLDAANKLIATKAKAKQPVPSEAVKQQVSSLRARLDALEARKTPYTAEELALFKGPEVKLVARAPAARGESEAKKKPEASGSASEKPPAKLAKRSLNDLPPGAGPLVAQAERDFAARRFAEAEDKYLQVLRMDEANPYTLANLAATQIEQDHFDAAETNLKKALQADSDDAFSLSLLGRLKVKQKKFDEAFETLSRSVKLDPQSAETQNYLGIVLSEKGQRGPAEAAFRKAIQLAPGYAVAHFNLAVAYATQAPPFLELARLHYRRALKEGHPKSEELEKLLVATKPVANSNP
jgi:Tfp pilus assembly protein PilF